VKLIPVVLMLQLATTVPVTVNDDHALKARASGANASMANKAARHMARLRRQDFSRRSVIGHPPSFGSQIMGPTGVQSSHWLSKITEKT